jgi:hypothetical protein
VVWVGDSTVYTVWRGTGFTFEPLVFIDFKIIVDILSQSECLIRTSFPLQHCRRWVDV